jgi:two-component system invasion response regulator UvrY
MQSSIRVFIADDHEMIRDGLARLIDASKDLVFAGEADNGQDVIQQARDAEWDVLVLDLNLPGGGEATLQSLQSIRPKLPVIIFSMHPEDQYALRLLKAGAMAYLTKGRPSSELLDAIRTVAQGKKYVTHELAMKLLDGNGPGEGHPHESLTDRENQVFMLLLGGKQPSEIVAELHVSASTVSTHINKIKQKLDAPTVVDIVKYAYRVGILH